MGAQVATEIPLRDRLDQDYREALKAHEASRVSVIRMARAAIQSAEKSKGSPLTEVEVEDVLTREAKLRRESLAEFERGGRFDLVSSESEALTILSAYMPPQLSEEEIRQIVNEAVSELDPDSLEDGGKQAIGQIMRTVMPKVRGRADGGVVNGIVRGALAERGVTPA